MYCRNCGNKLIENENFCHMCGTESVPKSKPITPQTNMQMSQATKALSDTNEKIFIVLGCLGLFFSLFFNLVGGSYYDYTNYTLVTCPTIIVLSIIAIIVFEILTLVKPRGTLGIVAALVNFVFSYFFVIAYQTLTKEILSQYDMPWERVRPGNGLIAFIASSIALFIATIAYYKKTEKNKTYYMEFKD